MAELLLGLRVLLNDALPSNHGLGSTLGIVDDKCRTILDDGGDSGLCEGAISGGDGQSAGVIQPLSGVWLPDSNIATPCAMLMEDSKTLTVADGASENGCLFLTSRILLEHVRGVSVVLSLLFAFILAAHAMVPCISTNTMLEMKDDEADATVGYVGVGVPKLPFGVIFVVMVRDLRFAEISSNHSF